jgi:hypothetical protein
VSRIHFRVAVSSLRCKGDLLQPRATKLGRVAGSWRETLSASAWFGKLPNTQAPVPVIFAATNLLSVFRALRTSG